MLGRQAPFFLALFLWRERKRDLDPPPKTGPFRTPFFIVRQTTGLVAVLFREEYNIFTKFNELEPGKVCLTIWNWCIPRSCGGSRLMPTDLDQTINSKAGMDSQT